MLLLGGGTQGMRVMPLGSAWTNDAAGVHSTPPPTPHPHAPPAAAGVWHMWQAGRAVCT